MGARLADAQWARGAAVRKPLGLHLDWQADRRGASLSWERLEEQPLDRPDSGRSATQIRLRCHTRKAQDRRVFRRARRVWRRVLPVGRLAAAPMQRCKLAASQKLERREPAFGWRLERWVLALRARPMAR